MPQNPGDIGALNWPALVAEAVRRRKKEKMTQKEHAALASVSIPTIIGFERGETTLSLAKAFAILRVVGLIEEQSPQGAQDQYVQDAFARWREVTATLPKNSPGRFPDGWYRIDYCLEGDLKDVELHQFPDVLKKAVIRHTGWPMFRLPTRPELEAREIDGVIECWMPPGDKGIERAFSDPAHCDFWRGAPSGRMFSIRGYQEDGQDTFPSGTIFDVTLPVWRLGEALLHAAKLAALLGRNPPEVTVHFRTLYTGLMGRDLKSWASPGTTFFGDGGRSKSDEAMLATSVAATKIETNLAEILLPLVSSLFERFSITGTSLGFVQAQLDRMRNNKF
jgi:transcriptional regulator with XRE-family HTH domain